MCIKEEKIRYEYIFSTFTSGFTSVNCVLSFQLSRTYQIWAKYAVLVVTAPTFNTIIITDNLPHNVLIHCTKWCGTAYTLKWTKALLRKTHLPQLEKMARASYCWQMYLYKPSKDNFQNIRLPFPIKFNWKVILSGMNWVLPPTCEVRAEFTKKTFLSE